MTVLSGPYTATWNGLAIGQTVQGFEKAYAAGARPINFDAMGETPVDMILNRMLMTVDFILAEADAAAVATLTWPWDLTRGKFPTAGKSLFALAKPLVLTSCGVLNPATITFHKAILAPDFQTRVLYSHRERYIPIQMLILPIKTGTSGSPVLPDACNEVDYFTEVAEA